MCNVPNPIPGRIYYPKGCAPALNTCGGGVEKTDVFMDKAKVTTPPHPTALCARQNQPLRPLRKQLLPRTFVVQLRGVADFGDEISDNCRDKMKFIYKLPHGYFPGGAYFKYAPTVNSSAWSANNLLVWITPKDISSGSPTTARAISQTTTLSRCGRALSQDAPETD